jgi:hypothetical protein
MTNKSDFNAEEWSKIVQGPPLAGLLVITAQKGGSLRESLALGKAYAEARQAQGDHPLLDSIVAEQPQIDPKRYDSPEALRSEGVQQLREAVELLEQKDAAPEEVDAYKGFIVALAERAAHAHKEGGFLGVGGEEVSESEQAMLDEIRAALDSPQQEHASAG